MLQLSSCKCPPRIQSQLPGVIKLTCIVLCQGQPDGGESCIVLESRSPRSPDAKLLQLSYVVHELCAASEERRCERGYRQVCVELCCWMSWRQTCIKMIAATYVSSVDLLSTFCARIQHGVQLHGGPQKNYTNCQNQVGNCPGQYGILTHTQKYTQKDKYMQLYMHTDMHTHMHRHTKTYAYGHIHSNI